MKVLMLCICVLVLATSNLADSKIMQQFKNAMSGIEEDIETCIEENSISAGDWYSEEQILNGSYAEPENEERTRKVGCTIACVLKKKNVMEGSNINERKLHEVLSRELGSSPRTAKTHKIAHDCVKEVKNITEKCEKSFSLFTCVIRAILKMHKHEDNGKAEIEENEETEQTV